MASQASNIHRLLEEVADASKNLPSDVFQDDAARKRLQEAAAGLSGALESPIDGVRRLIFQAQYLPIAQVAINGGWFEALAKTTTPQTAADLARQTGADELLIARLLRPLTTAGFVNEVGPQTYTQTPVTTALTVPYMAAYVSHFAYEVLPLYADLPQYMEKHGYKVPEKPAHAPFFDKFGSIQWDYFKENPERGQSFNSFMQGQQQGRTCWLEFYPAEERLIAELSKEDDAVLLVDVGGGRGHDLLELAKRKGTEHGRLILQDLPEVVADAPELKSVESMGYDFFAPQPVKGAKAYFFRRILHDWDTESCRKILRNHASAMKKGYSKLLLNDILVPETNAPFFVAGMDVAMMTTLAGMERTRTQWSELLDSEGLELVDVWQAKGGNEAVIEAVLKN